MCCTGRRGGERRLLPGDTDRCLRFAHRIVHPARSRPPGQESWTAHPHLHVRALGAHNGLFFTYLIAQLRSVRRQVSIDLQERNPAAGDERRNSDQVAAAPGDPCVVFVGCVFRVPASGKRLFFVKCFFVKCFFIKCFFIKCLFVKCLFVKCLFVKCVFRGLSSDKRLVFLEFTVRLFFRECIIRA
jgi:hypothetical protein